MSRTSAVLAARPMFPLVMMALCSVASAQTTESTRTPPSGPDGVVSPASEGDPRQEIYHAQWQDFRAQHFALKTKLPEGAEKAMAAQAPGRVPVVYPGAALTWADLNCDARPDFVLASLEQSDPVAQRVLGEHPPTKEQLEAVIESIHAGGFTSPQSYFIDRPLQLLVGVSSAGGYELQKDLSASYFDVRGPLGSPLDTLGCTHPSSPDFGPSDLKWAVEHRCEVLYLGCCEKDGLFLLWHREQKMLAGVGGC